ncbi:hypothetical protein Hanom_Chr04g00354041 [Helianthus anomalus]
MPHHRTQRTHQIQRTHSSGHPHYLCRSKEHIRFKDIPPRHPFPRPCNTYRTSAGHHPLVVAHNGEEPKIERDMPAKGYRCRRRRSLRW